jgi:hypothetical protein
MYKIVSVFFLLLLLIKSLKHYYLKYLGEKMMMHNYLKKKQILAI